MKIYTKTGDKGTTRLVDGACVEKYNPRVEAYGTVDELNSAVGVLISVIDQKRSELNHRQNKSVVTPTPPVTPIAPMTPLTQLTQLTSTTDLDVSKKLEDLIGDLIKIQHWLFNAGSLLATEKDEIRTKLPEISTSHIEYLELKIDEMTAGLPVLKNFILPSGDITSSQAHVCRTVCRRAERRSAEVLLPQRLEIDDPVLVFLNRLSDYFFTLARFLNKMSGAAETLWSKSTNG